MLKEDETEETGLFCHIFIIGSSLIGGATPPLTTPMRPGAEGVKQIRYLKRLLNFSNLVIDTASKSAKWDKNAVKMAIFLM